jgi:Protein of unknown function (DUF2510)
MDLPPSGWYPDPYGTPRLLRWWDGSGWTQHTHPDVTAAGAGAGGEPAATAVQGAAVRSPGLQSTGVQATAVQPTTGQPTAGQPTAGQPSAEWLSRTKPPTGQPTAPQPALPANPESTAQVAPTAYQAAVTTTGVTTTGVTTTGVTTTGPGIAPTALQSPAVRATGMQATAVQMGYPQPGAGGDGDGTHVLFMGGPAMPSGPSGPGGPGGPGGGPGGPGGPGQGNPYGYLEAQRRRRRRRVIGGLTAGTVAAVAAIVIIVASMSSSPSTPAADQSLAAAPPSPTASSPSAAPSATPTASASPAATASESLLTDTQSGLSYPQLPAPWQGAASCPPAINNVGAFPWTDGEYAVAGQINNGSTTWYGEACSGPLPAQYGYNGVADLQGTADNLAQTFENAYYGALNHTIAAGADEPVQVSGHAAWEVTYDVTYTNATAQGATWTDEQAAVVVVDTGTPEPAVFFTSIPFSLNEANVTQLVSALQLTSTPSGASTQPAATPPTPGANP